MAEVKPHWLAPAGKTSTPNVIVTFDTETSEVNIDDTLVQRLRCWDALVRVRRQSDVMAPHSYSCQGELAGDLATVVEQATDLDKEIWVIAHNVGFDLSVTSLPFILADRGWEVDAVHLGSESCWWILKRHGKKLVITDSWSWLRCPLDDAAKDIGKRKTRLPSPDDPLTTWHRRCRRDVEILDKIMVTLLDWWDEQQLGSFGITGAACGWRTLRKRIPRNRILVGPDGTRTAFERRAIFGGLKDVYGVGEFFESYIADYDFTAAYPTTAAAFQLPTSVAKKWCATDELFTTPLPPQRDYIAEVEITTRVPCAPCRIGDEIWRPVGTFRTTLAGPDVRYALEKAESVRVISWRAYRLTYSLADWATWLLSVQTAPADKVPPVVARVAKGWGRSAIGRFASRTSRVIATRPATHLGWHLETGHDLTTGVALEWLTIGDVEQTIAKDLDGPDVFPGVLAFVESHTRVALSRMMDTRDPTSLLQCNTDGWWEMRAPNTHAYSPPNVPWPYQVTRKALERRLLVRGPNHVMTPHERRYAGIPRKAVTDDDKIMRWHDWPGMRWQLEHGEQGQYHRPPREAVLSDHYVRRWVLDTGETIPVTTTILENGDTAVLPWSQTWGRQADDVLAGYQVPTLARLLNTDVDPAYRVNVVLPTQPGRGFRYEPKPVRREIGTKAPRIRHKPPGTPEPLIYPPTA